MKVANDSLATAKRDGRDGREKLILMLRRYLKTMIGELNESLLLTEEHALTPSDRAKLIEKRDAFERELRAVVKEGIRDGSIVSCDPKLAIFVLARRHPLGAEMVFAERAVDRRTGGDGDQRNARSHAFDQSGKAACRRRWRHSAPQ